MTLYYGDEFKWFVGIVKGISPDRARVKVRIFGIHRMDDTQRLSNEDLPWAQVVYPVTGNQAGSGNFSHDLQPETWVVGFFADGDDCRYPIVIGVFGTGENSQSYYGPSTSYRGGEGTPGSGTPTGGFAPSNLPGTENAEKAYNFFRSRLESEGISGDPHVVASTIVGFLQHESGAGLDPTILNTGGSSAYGVAQWLGSRRGNLFRRWGYPYPGRGAFARRGNYNNGPTFEQQLQFIWEEFRSADGGGSWRYLENAQNPERAGVGMIRFERNEAWQRGPSGYYVNTRHPNFIAGVRNARNIMRLYGDTYNGDIPPTPVLGPGGRLGGRV